MHRFTLPVTTLEAHPSAGAAERPRSDSPAQQKFQLAPALEVWRGRLVRRGAHALALLWLGLGVVGGLNHRLWPGLYEQRGALPKLMPHLRYGYVMFDRMPERFTVATYREATGGSGQPLAQLMVPSSWGYEEARAFIMLNMYPGFLDWLCQQRPERAVTFELQRYHLGQSLELGARQSFRCLGGHLHAITTAP